MTMKKDTSFGKVQTYNRQLHSKHTQEKIDYANEVCAIIDREDQEEKRVKNQLGKSYIFTIARIESILPK